MSHGSSTVSATNGIRDSRWVVTGAARGLGLALTRLLSAQGAQVFALARQPGPLAGLSGVRHVGFDQSDEEAIAVASGSLPGQIDYVVHNAAIRGDTGGLSTFSAADLTQVMQVNVAGPLLLTRSVLPHLSADATIAFISSRAGSFTEGHDPDGDYSYCLSKAALNRSVAKLADDLPYRIIAIHPGWIRTDMGGDAAPDDPTAAAKRIIDLLSGSVSPVSGALVDSFGYPIAP